MDTRTGVIRELVGDEKANENEVPLTRDQADRLRLKEQRADRPDLFAAEIAALTRMHPGARPEGLTEEEWLAQKNAAKRIRKMRRA